MCAGVDAGAFTKFYPASTRQIAVYRAYGVLVNMQSQSKLAGARQSLTRLVVAAKYRHSDLSRKLVTHRYIARLRKPQFHTLAAAIIHSRSEEHTSELQSRFDL